MAERIHEPVYVIQADNSQAAAIIRTGADGEHICGSRHLTTQEIEQGFGNLVWRPGDT